MNDHRVDAWEYDASDPDWGWYWELWVDGRRVNGGLGTSHWDAKDRGRKALYAIYRSNPSYKDSDIPGRIRSTHPQAVDCDSELLG